MTKYKLSSYPGQNDDNYICTSKGLSVHTSSRLLTHKEMYQSHSNLTEVAIPDPA